MNIDHLTRKQKETLFLLLKEKQRRNKLNIAIKVYNSMYAYQHKFTAATKDHYEICLCAANQVGKTYIGTFHDSIHLTGDYPDDWQGHKFDFAPMCWGLGITMEKTRDLLQTALFGRYESGIGFSGGLVPADRIVSWESATGTINAMRTVRVKHRSGDISTMQFWSYSQGHHKIMGDVVDWTHVDEEPVDQKIRPQLLTRSINGDKGKGGKIIYTFTPENGRTELVVQLMDEPTKDQFFMRAGWDDAPHITPEKAERLLAQFPAHQRDMRSKGIPMLGHGRIYDLSEDFITCDMPDIQDHWRIIDAMDFGWDHPQAHIQMVIDPDNEIIYITHAWKQSRTSANDAYGATSSWSKDIPTAWPHDGLMHEKGRDDAAQQKDHYEKAGFNLLHAHSTWEVGGYGVEAGLYEINDLLRKGKFKICRSLRQLLDEFLQYHRGENGKIAKVNDDLLDAVRYAYMMRRYAKRVGDIGAKKKKIEFTKWR